MGFNSGFKALKYNRIASIKSPSFCVKTFSAGLTNLLPHSHDCRYYVSRRMLACPPIWLRKYTDLRAHDLAQCFCLRQQLGSLTLPAPEVGDLVELIVRYSPAFDWRSRRSHDPNLPPPLKLFCMSLRDSNLTQCSAPFQSWCVCWSYTPAVFGRCELCRSDQALGWKC